MSDRKRSIMRPVQLKDSFSPFSKKRTCIPGPLSMLSRNGSDSKNALKLKNVTNVTNELVDLNPSDCDASLSKVNVAWDMVVRLFGSESWKIIDNYTIDKIIKNAEKGFPRGKIPVLCASVEKIDTVLPIAKAVLQDETGKIGCSIDKSVIHKYRKFLCIGAVLVLKQISLFSLNRKTYLNITLSNVTRIFLGEAILDSRLLANARTLEDVTVCGPNFPLTQPPLSLEELQNLVSECLSPPSAPTPSSPILRSAKPLKSPEITPRTSVGSPNKPNPMQLKRHPPRHKTHSVQPDRNWRLNAGGSKPVAVGSAVFSHSTPKLILPSRPRFGIRSILRESRGTTSTIPIPPSRVIDTARIEESAVTYKEAKSDGDNSTVNRNTSNDVESSVPMDWMEDDVDHLLASMVD